MININPKLKTRKALDIIEKENLWEDIKRDIREETDARVLEEKYNMGFHTLATYLCLHMLNDEGHKQLDYNKFRNAKYSKICFQMSDAVCKEFDEKVQQLQDENGWQKRCCYSAIVDAGIHAI